MKTFKFKFPGDPVATVIHYSRAELLAAHPRQPTRIYGAGGLEALISVPRDMIMCDTCGEDPLDSIYVVGSRAECQKCADRYILPHKITGSEKINYGPN